MKKIVPFNNVLEFNTDIARITAISLEHEIKKEESSICGEFFISGEYKITDGQLDNDKFNFELPFDIAFGCDYNLDTLVIDIDDFRYEVVGRNKLKVNIDLYIDGEEIVHPLETNEEDIATFNEEDKRIDPIDEDDKETKDDSDKTEELELIDDEEDSESDDSEETEAEEDTEEEKEETSEEDDNEEIENSDLLSERPVIDNIDLLSENNKEDNVEEDKINIDIDNVNDNDNNNENIDIFSGFNEEEKYVTYRVYRVSEGDTIDKIMEKYNVSREELEKYNSLEDIKPGVKLIIPSND